MILLKCDGKVNEKSVNLQSGIWIRGGNYGIFGFRGKLYLRREKERASVYYKQLYLGKNYLLAYFPKHYVNKKVPKKPGNFLIAPSNLDIYRAGNTENKYVG